MSSYETKKNVRPWIIPATRTVVTIGLLALIAQLSAQNRIDSAVCFGDGIVSRFVFRCDRARGEASQNCAGGFQRTFDSAQGFGL